MNKTVNIFFISVFVVSFYININAQSPITWQRVLNNNYGEFHKAHQTVDGGYIAIGTDQINGYSKIYLTKFNNLGDSIWARIIGSIPNESYDGFWCENTYDNGFIIAGDGDGSMEDAYLGKTDSSGIILWQKTFGGFNIDQGNCVKQTSDSGFIVTIRTISNNGFNNILVVKTYPDGSPEWEKVYLTNDDQYGMEVIEVNNGYAIAGSAQNRMYLMRLNSTGDTLWTKKYGDNSEAFAYSIQETPDNGFIIGGKINSNNSAVSYIVKTDSSGNSEWQRTYTETFEELLFSIRNLPGKGYIFCGTTDSAFHSLERGFIRIIDFKGNVLTEKFYRGLPYFTEIRSVEITSDNGFILSGVTSSGRPKMFIAKTDSLGNIHPVGLSNLSIEIPNEFILLQNFPNPFNSLTKIKFDIKYKAKIILAVYDISGKEVVKLFNQELKEGSYLISFSPDFYNLSSGVYYYVLSDEQTFVSAKKMLYIK